MKQKTFVRGDAWFAVATQCAVKIRRQFGTPDKLTAQRIARAFGAALRPRMKAGRKPEWATLRAAQQWSDGMSRFTADLKATRSLKTYQRELWQQIYRDVFPDFATMDNLTRGFRTAGLRRNVKAYLNRKARKSTLSFATPRENTRSKM